MHTTSNTKQAPVIAHRCPLCSRRALEQRGPQVLCVPALGGCGSAFGG